MLLVRKNCTLWPQTVLKSLAALHEKIKTNIHLTTINPLEKYEQYFKQNCFIFFLNLSLKIVMNLCILSSKQETARHILTTTRSQVTQVVFFFHLSIIFRHVTLINTETLNLKLYHMATKS